MAGEAGRQEGEEGSESFPKSLSYKGKGNGDRHGLQAGVGSWYGVQQGRHGRQVNVVSQTVPVPVLLSVLFLPKPVHLLLLHLPVCSTGVCEGE